MSRHCTSSCGAKLHYLIHFYVIYIYICICMYPYILLTILSEEHASVNLAISSGSQPCICALSHTTGIHTDIYIYIHIYITHEG